MDYCRWDNHYHLVIKTPQRISLGMRQLNGCYTQTFNHRHERVGPPSRSDSRQFWWRKTRISSNCVGM